MEEISWDNNRGAYFTRAIEGWRWHPPKAAIIGLTSNKAGGSSRVKTVGSH